MNALPGRVHIVEEGPREGFQIEPQFVPTAQKLELIDALADAGLQEIQTASFVPPANVPGWADADDVVARLVPRDGVRYGAIWLNLRGYERALAHRSRLSLYGALGFSMSDAFVKANQNLSREENFERQWQLAARYLADGLHIRHAFIMAAFGCNREGEVAVEDLLDEIAAILARAAQSGIAFEYLTLADTMGWATPSTMTYVLDRVRNRFPDLALGLHLHDTRGQGLACAWVALNMGVQHFDTSVAGLGGCPFADNRGVAGNICTEDFVHMCHAAGIKTGVDLERLVKASQLAERIVGHSLPGGLRRAGVIEKRGR